MARAYILFFFLLVSIASSDLEPDDDDEQHTVFLVQTLKARDDLKTREDLKALPELDDAFEKQQSTLQSVRDTMGAFEKRLLYASQNGQAHTVVLKARLEENLTAATAENKVLEEQNADLLLQIGRINANVSKLRDDYAELQKSNRVWVADLKAMLVNITSAQDFVALALNASDDALEEAPGVTMVKRIEEIEKNRSAKQALERSLLETHHAPANKSVSLLQVDRDIEKDIENEGHDMVKLLGNALTNVKNEADASRAELLSAFQTDYDALTKRHAELLERQSELNQTNGAQAELQHRLNLALAHLEETQTDLKDHAKAVRAYERRIGSKPMPDESVDST